MPGPSQPGQMRLRAVAGLCLNLKPGGAGRVPHTGRGCPRWRRPRTGLSRGADRRRRLPGPRDHSVSWQFPPSALRGFEAIGPFQWMRHRRSRAGFINREKFEENFRGGPGAPRPPAEEGQVPPAAEDADWNRQRPAASGTRPPQGGANTPLAHGTETAGRWTQSAHLPVSRYFVQQPTRREPPGPQSGAPQVFPPAVRSPRTAAQGKEASRA